MIPFIIFVVLFGGTYSMSCQDFVITTNVEFESGSSLKILRTSRGIAECEEECRKNVDCEAFSLEKYGHKRCYLKNAASTKLLIIQPGFVSGVKTSDLGFEGNMFDINYCRESQRARQCSTKPDCSSQLCQLGFKTDNFGCIMPSCECRKLGDTPEIMFGDLVLTEDTVHQVVPINEDQPDGALSGVDITVRRWNNAKQNGQYIIPYTKHRLSTGAHSALAQGMAALERGTCLKFVPRSNQHDYLDFFVGGGCYSQVGRRGGRQEISLGSGCWYSHTASHEIMHALGFWHEQMRPDRDSYITVHFNNISPAMRYNFNKMNTRKWKSFGQGYDITSVMQYHGTAFSMNGRPTMTDKYSNRAIPWNTKISASDFSQLNSLYPCSTHPTQKPGTAKPTPRPTKGPTGSCSDKNKYCASWSQSGECKKNPTYMNINCRKSCRLCSGGGGGGGGGGNCTDKASHCAHWASTGECSRNPAYMIPNCPKSCNRCGSGGGGGRTYCTDNHTSCLLWAKGGYCSSNAYARSNCKKSCRLC